MCFFIIKNFIRTTRKILSEKAKRKLLEKYGEFYFVEEDPTTGRITCGRYYIEDFITFVFGGRNEVRALYFVVHFDKNDIADNAYEKYGLPGG